MRRSASGRALFDDRIHAGRQLANNLREHAEADVVVLSVSRGGAIVGSVIAESLGHSIPHLYYIVRPIPCPSIPRLSLGSVAGDGSVRIDNVVAKSMGIVCDDATHNVQATELMRMVEDMDLQLRAEQESFWQPAPSAQDLEGKTLLVVDDGMEAGDTMREAIMHLRHCYEASRIIVAVPFCMADLRRQLQRHVESVVDIVSPLFVGSIARWYARGVSASVAEQRLLNRLFVDSATTISSFDYD
ncbi:hypothetical protein GGI26_004420 [Coemansia sp. RSA 1358]|nr:phosphoribosyltransferase-like protein [Coemansia spiralis]KAJ1988421.1 hypothetical protein EDC05_005301 [Coemansia umbellata]KAJ2621076.1 hypothetical protein GGI26_004420 [Coemansia sp. RSA 1358]